MNTNKKNPDLINSCEFSLNILYLGGLKIFQVDLVNICLSFVCVCASFGAIPTVSQSLGVTPGIAVYVGNHMWC